MRAHRVLETFVFGDGRDGQLENKMSSLISECSLMSITKSAACGGERMRVEQRASERKSRTGFGSPYDVVNAPTLLLLSAACDTASARIDLGKGDPMQYSYNTGYLFKTGATSWAPFTY